MKYFEYQILDSEDVANETKLIQDFLDKHPLGNQDSLQKSTSISALDNFNELIVRKGNYWYYYKKSGGKFLFCCVEATDETQDNFCINNVKHEVILHHNASVIVKISISPNNKFIAFLERKTAGILQLRIKHSDPHAETSNDVIIPNVGSTIAWSPDSSSIFYTKSDSTLRPSQLWIKNIVDGDAEILLLHETDLRFGIIVSNIDDEIISLSSSPDVSETRIFNYSNDLWKSDILISRTLNLNHRVFGINTSEGRRHYIVRTTNNLGEYNLYSVSSNQLGSKTDISRWVPIFSSTREHILGDVFTTRELIILSIKTNTLYTIKVLDRRTFRNLPIPLPMNADSELINFRIVDTDFENSTFRFIRSSYTHPPLLYNYSYKKRAFLKINSSTNTVRNQHILAHRVTVLSGSCRIPLTLIRNNRMLYPSPCILIAYGAYQHSLDPDYLAEWIPLIDEGIMVAIAHVRGGGEHGGQWHQAGRGLNKTNSFTDYNSCINYLLSSPLVDAKRLGLFAVSAGALLPAYFMNNRPGIAKACLVRQPFVNPYAALLNPALPLTATDWSEFGNPIEDSAAKHLIESYSPLQNVQRQEYPTLAVILGEHDTRISNRDALDWVQKIRQNNTAHTKCLCSVVPNTGHGATHPEFEYVFWHHHLLS
ncbi:peptidase, S9A/B/C family, catalytic domain protein [Mobiluncus mulieris ATCC 35239]|uniref:Peptidase, S9A/B/C family, catalytic domain protein n=2 Tax=Mobiluncus mulieris TaxID=2052 RepID=E0QS25_9ACTO|nr:prolyl oligopeptidase family serine peptidase [Mobiluncus mulieris]EFM45601.1 peptidase, S9A/B/C family, catalytic domain protein [Mobiluncus mulieris ATCC 35239]MCU9972165.1 prolyl oligopeptidase family serine peptidase [Mobiluncus mulieris]MCU9994776.1 prolyl oligopeptidase family serine peptidase [Mobiluncus mulieris]NMW91995.1 prolyl oligopeptidase family serine peptidase [Mobiluncus mulieris]NMW94063.1 prolyl oligopeptidase family serine peptidase [Mobiluncus mulieris]